MVERILPFFQRGEKSHGRASFPKAWPDNLSLCRLSSSAKDTLSLADAKTGVLITACRNRGRVFPEGVVLRGKQSRAVNIQVVGAVFGIQASASNCTVQDCFITGTGPMGTGVLVSGSATGVLVKGNQISRFLEGISITAGGSASFASVGNYVADCKYGLFLGADSFYRENAVTNCTEPFNGGNAIGTENGGD
jgi:hypothetical protein